MEMNHWKVTAKMKPTSRLRAMTIGSVTNIFKGTKNVTIDMSFKVTPLSASMSFRDIPLRLARRLWISRG